MGHPLRRRKGKHPAIRIQAEGHVRDAPAQEIISLRDVSRRQHPFRGNQNPRGDVGTRSDGVGEFATD